MPFLTEELWHDELFGQRSENDCCIVAPYPQPAYADQSSLKDMDIVKLLISEIRNIRNAKQISPKEPLVLNIRVNSNIDYTQYLHIISKLANVKDIEFVTEKVSGGSTFMAGRDEFFIILAGNIDVAAERERLDKEIVYLQGFLQSVNAKLSNERFMQNAKADIVENEQRKKSDAEIRIRILEESLQVLQGN